MSLQKPLQDADFPSLFLAADDASKRAQVEFLRLVKADLLFIVGGATLSSIPSSDEITKTWLAIIGSCLLVVGFFVTIWIRFSQSEKTWYGGRAIAESVKTLAWRYMMSAEPYSSTLSSQEVDKKFSDSLAKILSEKKHLVVTFDDKLNIRDQISVSMKKIRSLNFSDRLQCYLHNRIKEQRSWYSAKSRWNEKQERVWFGVVLLTQAFAFTYSLIIVKNQNLVNWTGVFAALSTATLMWLQVKKFRELAQVYAVTAQDLGLVEIQSTHVKDDNSLSNFVSDAENAISREHTLWIARRDH